MDEKCGGRSWTFPVLEGTCWPEGMVLRREDLYDNDLCEDNGIMNATVQKIAAEVRSLPKKELDEFLSWLAEYELSHPDRWDEQIERDAQSDGRLHAVLKRVRDDIEAGRTKPLDEVINNS